MSFMCSLYCTYVRQTVGGGLSAFPCQPNLKPRAQGEGTAGTCPLRRATSESGLIGVQDNYGLTVAGWPPRHKSDSAPLAIA